MLVAQHPRVLGAAPLRRVHDQRAFGERHARKAPRYDGDSALARKHERTKIDMTRCDPLRNEGRTGGESERRLRDVTLGVLLDQRPELLALLTRALRADEH